MINVTAVKIGVGLVVKVVADKGVNIVAKSAIKGLETNAQKACVWVSKMAVGKVAGDCAYNAITGRNFNKDANEFLETHLKKVKKDCENSEQNKKEIQVAEA